MWEVREWHVVSLIYSVFKILISYLTLTFGIFNPDALKNLCVLCWHFVFSLFSFLFNLTYDCFSLFLLRVIFLAYHVCLFSRFPFWSISSYYTPNIISEKNIMFILHFLTKLSPYILLSKLANRSCKVSQIWLCSTDFLDFLILWHSLN